MASIFTKIINREIPGHIVAEDAQHIAILDINPNAKVPIRPGTVRARAQRAATAVGARMGPR